MKKIIIIKIGGGKDINIEGIAKDISEIKEKCIIVHGANHFRDELYSKLGKEKKILTSLSGYSSVFSNTDMIDSIMMAYSGLRNKRIVECLQKNGVNAIGLSGIDGRLIVGKKNQGIKIKEGEKIKLIRDFSGKPQSINKELLMYLLEKDYLPVISIPIIDENGEAINTENDDVVSLIKKELGCNLVIHFIEAPGILKDKNDPDSLIKKLTQNDLLELESKVEGRMKRKILALRKLNPCRIIVADGKTENPLKDALDEKGTVVI